MEESHLNKSHCTRVNAYLPEPWGDVIAAHAHSWNKNGPLCCFLLCSSISSLTKQNACAVPNTQWVLELTQTLPCGAYCPGRRLHQSVLMQTKGLCLGEGWPGGSWQVNMKWSLLQLPFEEGSGVQQVRTRGKGIQEVGNMANMRG